LQPPFDFLTSPAPPKMSAKRSSFFAPKKKPATNPFDSDDDVKPQQRSARASSVPPPADQRPTRASSVPPPANQAPFGAGDGLSSSSSSYAAPPVSRHYRNDFRDAGGLESQSVQDLEGYAAYKAEDTTRRTQGCLKIAEEMRDTASSTLVSVHQQGQQIRRTHMMALDIDQGLSRVRTNSLRISTFFHHGFAPTVRR
jgi:synaptosomal-associated protein 25